MSANSFNQLVEGYCVLMNYHAVLGASMPQPAYPDYTIRTTEPTIYLVPLASPAHHA